MGRKVCLRCKGKTLLGVIKKLLEKSKVCWHHPAMFCQYYLKWTFPPIIPLRLLKGTKLGFTIFPSGGIVNPPDEKLVDATFVFCKNSDRKNWNVPKMAASVIGILVGTILEEFQCRLFHFQISDQMNWNIPKMAAFFEWYSGRNNSWRIPLQSVPLSKFWQNKLKHAKIKWNKINS